jgi:gluconate 2-dehydrogenase gamma chain
MATNRRRLLVVSLASLLISLLPARARTIAGKLPWHPSAGVPPTPARPGGWEFFNAEEAAAVEALVDRLIPPDPKFPGGKDAGCAVFIDRQLGGPYGSAQGLYMHGPFQDGTPQQGMQSSKTPAEQYRAALAALDKHCRATQGGKPFAALSDQDRDKIISGLEDGSLQLEGVRGSQFFSLLLQNTKEGFFADPVYGGNRDMAGWKMIGFPGARYDYRDWVERHNEPYPLPPVGIQGRAEWAPQRQ